MPATALRLLLALTLVFNGVTSAWAMVRPCHAAASANAALEQPSPVAPATVATHHHQSHDMHGMMHSAHRAAHASMQGPADPTDMDHRLCDGTCCKGMACPGHAPASAALQPTLPHTPTIAAARVAAHLARPATRALPFPPPFRPPAN